MTLCGCRRERERWWDEAFEERRCELDVEGVIVAAVGVLVVWRRRLLPGALVVVEEMVRVTGFLKMMCPDRDGRQAEVVGAALDELVGVALGEAAREKRCSTV